MADLEAHVAGAGSAWHTINGAALLELALDEIADDYRAKARSMFDACKDLTNREGGHRHPPPDELAAAAARGADAALAIMHRSYAAISPLFSPSSAKLPRGTSPCVSLQAYLDAQRGKLQAEILRQIRLRYKDSTKIIELWRAYDKFEIAHETESNHCPCANSAAAELCSARGQASARRMRRIARGRAVTSNAHSGDRRG